MDNCCNCHSEISRDGSGQLSRYLKALDPSYTPIDDRSIEDLLVFAKRYANQIRFYDIADSKINDGADSEKISWREFFRRDIAVITASVAIVDLAQFKKDYEELRAKLEQQPIHGLFENLFAPILGLASKIEGWYALSIPGYPLYADLELAIHSNLKEQVQKIVAYEEGFKYVDTKHPLSIDYSVIRNKSLWGLDNTIDADISIYKGADTEDKIRAAALYVDDVFNSFYGFISQLQHNSDSYMQFALKQYPAHQPHMALFITFLQLFRIAQKQLNGITEKMLDFYYKDILHLTAKPSIPDKAHIVLELAKDIAEYDVAPGSVLKAGKDAGGKDQLYTTASDLVVNAARVKELKTIFIETTSGIMPAISAAAPNNRVIQNIYARPKAKSRDGFGEPFTDATPKWPTFGKGGAAAVSNNLCDNILLPDAAGRKDMAQLGFAIASPQLLLQGGNRLLQISFAGNAQTFLQTAKDFETQHEAQIFFGITLSGEKDWLEIKEVMSQKEWENLFVSFTNAAGIAGNTDIFNPDITRTTGAYFIDIKNSCIAVFLPMAEQAVIGFDAKLHKGYDFKTTRPIIQVKLNTTTGIPLNDYTGWSTYNIQLYVKVGSINPLPAAVTNPGVEFPATPDYNYHFDGLKKLILQNENGLVAAGKPFDPFTAYPAQGKSFYIGSEEVFNKPLNQLAVNFIKTQQAGFDFSQFSSGIYDVSVLHNRNWDELSNEEGQTFDQEHLSYNILYHQVPADGEGVTGKAITLDREPITHFTQWQPQTEKGFLEITYQNQTPADMQGRQALAIGLEIKEVSVSYESDLVLKPGIDQFFHLYPFGVVEIYLYVPESAADDFDQLDKAKNGLLVKAGNALLPQFRYASPYADYYQSNAAMTQSNAVPDSIKSLPLHNLLYRNKGETAAQLMLNVRNLSSTASGANQYTGDTQEGMLFIGLEKLKPLQTVTMLFQFAEGSADNEDDDPPAINWSYLSYNEWKPMQGESIVADGTYGFQTTGIIKISIPADASTNNTIITDGLLWLCASVTSNANRIPQLIDIITQAVEVTFKDQDNDPSHFDAALPAGSIGKLATPVAQVSKVAQPFASFDGKHQEVGKEFYTRVSERLRHKGRAVTAWDYEHLVLNRFPEIYKVKCITHTDPNCLCRDHENTDSSTKTFTLTYSGDSNFDAASAANINAVIQELKSNMQVKATITAYAPDGNIAHATGVADNLKIKINTGGGIDTSRLTTSTAANGMANTVDVLLDGYIENTSDCCGPQIAPGHVLIIPVANLKNRNAANPLQPKTSRRTLLAIQDYLKTRTSPFVQVHAKNPVYEEMIVQFKVQFYSGIDKGYYMKQLNEEIVHFLTPWAFDEDAAVTFNQKMYASSVINFIEERSYVDFITDFVMGVCCNTCCPPVATSAGTIIKGSVQDSAGVPLKELNIIAASDADILPVILSDDGSFSLPVTAQHVVTLTFSAPGYQTKIITAGNETEFQITLYKSGEALQRSRSCCDIEQVLQSDTGAEGDIVAKPCTSRSVLVSVPQHIIIPYVPPVQLSPCEKRKTDKMRRSSTAPGINMTTPANNASAGEAGTAADALHTKAATGNTGATITDTKPAVKHITKPKKPK